MDITIDFLSPPPDRPLEELFKHLHPNHDYTKEVIVRINNYIKDKKIDKLSPKAYPAEMINYLTKALQCRFECYRMIGILGLILAVDDFQAWVLKNENEQTIRVFMKELSSSMTNYICSLKLDGTPFQLIDNPESNTKEPIDKHECSPGSVVEYLRRVYNSC